MSENRSCMTGRDLVAGDTFGFEVNTTITIHAFHKAPAAVDGVVPNFRMAEVTIGPGSILRQWAIHDEVFYQLCNR